MTLIHCCLDDLMRFRFAASPDMKIETSFLHDVPGPRTPHTSLNRLPTRQHAIRLDWAYVAACFQQDIASRVSAMQEHGFRGVLNELSPALSFADGRLHINDGKNDEITLSGTGLVLTPSMFWKGPPLLLHKDLSDDVPCLVYPARRPTIPDDLEKGLKNLFGATRAAALRAVQQSRTTSELAELLGTSVATASRHAAALRVVGLVDSKRAGKAVRHRLTQLGWAIVASAPVKTLSGSVT